MTNELFLVMNMKPYEERKCFLIVMKYFEINKSSIHSYTFMHVQV